jgi:aspartokinase
MLVLSALSQVTNRLEKCIQEAVAGQELLSLQFIEETHRRLAKEVGLDANWCVFMYVIQSTSGASSRRRSSGANSRSCLILALLPSLVQLKGGGGKDRGTG